MATIRIPIMNNIQLDGSGEVGYAPYSVEAVSAVHDLAVYLFLAGSGVKAGLSGMFHVPKNYVDTPKIIVEWAANATTGSWNIDFDLTAVADDEDLDPSAVGEALALAAAAPTTAFNRESDTLTPTLTLVVDDLVLWTLSRDDVTAGDTLSVSAIVFAVFFEYNDS